jgi:hypothetical protein
MNRAAQPSDGTPQSRVLFDKSEGSVKSKLVLGSAGAPLSSPPRLRTKTLEISP